MPTQTILDRGLRLPQATSLVVGTIIGASIFVQPSEITGKVPTLGGTALVWLAAGLLTFFGALVCAELASAMPRSGGVYVYLSEAFSPALGFLWGWAMFWTMHSGIIAAIAVIFARYLSYFVELSAAGQSLAAILAILVLSGINYAGMRPASALQTLFTAGKLLAILAIVVVGFALGPADSTVRDIGAEGITSRDARAAGTGATVTDFVLALVAGLFAFGGWHMVTYSAEETVKARRTIPRALMLGVLIVTLCYIAMNAVYFHVLPLEKVISSTRVAADAADAVLGFGGGAVLSGLVVFSTLGALLGIILAGPRVYFAMARDGYLFGWMGKLHGRFRTPYVAIVVQAVWASFLVLTGTYRALFSRVVYTEWIFFGLLAVALIQFRQRGDLEPSFRLRGYPLIPVLFLLSSFFIVANHVVAEPRESLIGLSLVLAGLPVYFLWAAKNSRKEEKP